MVGLQHAPILLYGFDWDVQERLINFDHPWAAAFLTPRFTDERHESLRLSCYHSDPEKKREIKYGNNVSVLFRCLLHLGERSGRASESFWLAVAKGFSTNTKSLIDTIDGLVEARRVRRRVIGKDSSETARAADRWISFIDNRDAPPDQHLTPAVQAKIVQQFLAGLEGRMVNEASIPLNSALRNQGTYRRQPPLGPRQVSMPPYRRESGGSLGSISRHDALISPRSASRERFPHDERLPRKRSPSPARYPDPKRQQREAGGQNAWEPPKSTVQTITTGISSAGQQQRGSYQTQTDEPAVQPAPSAVPSLKEQPRAEGQNARLETSKPASQPTSIGIPTVQNQRSDNPNQATRPETPKRVAGPASAEVQALVAHPSPSSSDADPSRQLLEENNAMMRDHVDELKAQLAKAEAKIEALGTVDKLGDGIGKIRDEISIIKSVMGTMVSSMRSISDNIDSAKEESSRKTADLPEVLNPIRSLSETVALLQGEVSSLRNAFVSSSEKQQVASVAAAEVAQNQLKSVIQDQNAHFAQVMHEMARTQGLVSSALGARKRAPGTLRDAIAEAERDIRHHLKTVSEFYHQLGSGAGNRGLVEKTADLLLDLEKGLASASRAAG
ncbi:hypothetical protein QBC47DRAFT_387485 [Echria macrotheca]|uniref:Uncharacterized protein n=1 Tax=Echria macrotheca TaxID=438768 RepID=A0AAJ0B847_9PEZI|nr:hypothetical protein QBC47DRAFT_387485 [Echria macrotheca]